jgi:Flp pilus assembly protein TadB
VSKQRAIRRAEREAEAARARAARERAAARKAKRRQMLRRVMPRRPDHRVGKLYPRRSYGERVLIALAAVVAVGLIWLYVSSFATRIALTATLLIVAPAIIVLAFGRRSH